VRVCDEGHIAIQKGVGGHEGIKVGTRKDSDLPSRTVEVGGDGILCLMTFAICNIDIAKGGSAGSRRDAEDDARSWTPLLG
jgi:hypothetical protein